MFFAPQIYLMDKDCVAAGSGNSMGRLRKVSQEALFFLKDMNATFLEEFSVEIGHFLCACHYMSEYISPKAAAKTKGNFSWLILLNLLSFKDILLTILYW